MYIKRPKRKGENRKETRGGGGDKNHAFIRQKTKCKTV